MHRVFPYVERGFYEPQIERLLALFPPAGTLRNGGSTMAASPRNALGDRNLSRRLPTTRTGPEYIILTSTGGPADLDTATRTRLDALYAEDITNTAKLTGLVLADWLSPTYAQPAKV